jgi:hypothetical protein
MKEKPLDNWFLLDGGALALDDGDDWLGIIGHCSGVIEDILGCIWAHNLSLHNFSSRAKYCVVSWVTRWQPPEMEVTNFWQGL